MAMGKIPLRCDSCRYKFSRSIAPALCPFCGKASVEEDTRTGAADILREVDDMERSLSSRKE